MYYYLCKRCNHMAKQKIEMKRHLKKNNQCKIENSDNILSDLELYNQSLIKHIIMASNSTKNAKSDTSSDISSISSVNSNNYKCLECNKYFYNKSNLTKHQKNVCLKTPEVYIENQNIININNINNININYIKGFDEDWDTSKINADKKGEILLSNSKFTKTLENDVNLNVILNENNIGIVYKHEKNKYEPMIYKDIIEKSMEKIYKHLKDFYYEIINNNPNDLSIVALENELAELEKKYINFFTVSEAENIVNKTFTSIYNKNKDKSEDIYYSITKTDDNRAIEEIEEY